MNMKKYRPGASIHSNYHYICDCCEKEDGRPILTWESLPQRKGHFALCFECISQLYIDYVSFLDKQGDSIIIKRQNITEKLRNEIFERDNNQCVKCKSKLSLHIDHIIPFSMGGETTQNNLQTLCKKCNLSKGNK